MLPSVLCDKGRGAGHGGIRDREAAFTSGRPTSPKASVLRLLVSASAVINAFLFDLALMVSALNMEWSPSSPHERGAPPTVKPGFDYKPATLWAHPTHLPDLSSL